MGFQPGSMKPRPLVLTGRELGRLREFMKACSKAECLRAEAVIQRAQGIPHRKAASMLGAHVRNVFRWVERYRGRGVDGLSWDEAPAREEAQDNPGRTSGTRP